MAGRNQCGFDISNWGRRGRLPPTKYIIKKVPPDYQAGLNKNNQILLV